MRVTCGSWSRAKAPLVSLVTCGGRAVGHTEAPAPPLMVVSQLSPCGGSRSRGLATAVQPILNGTQRRVKNKKMLQFAEMMYLLVYLCTIWSVFTSFRICEAVPFQSQKNTTNNLHPRPCWEIEEYSIVRECSPCTDYEKTVHIECKFTGFVEDVKCTKDHRYRSCRSVAMEEVKFWKFEGIVVLVGVIFAIIVTYRQRTLDRHAEQKVRRQLEEI
ncbi:protein JTB [Leucoraja erinacea]|uniref:protein JTB n=1 Tax=Leucoraja erinaceus TaxID=7782 RepID=UPI00245855D5|nr:protein JTB [Leucoraja erinacea]